MSINTNIIKAGTYKVEIVFTLDEDTRESAIDRMFEEAMHYGDIAISESDTSEYFEIDD